MNGSFVVADAVPSHIRKHMIHECMWSQLVLVVFITIQISTLLINKIKKTALHAWIIESAWPIHKLYETCMLQMIAD